MKRILILLSILFVIMVQESFPEAAEQDKMEKKEQTLFAFKTGSQMDQWLIVNDGVMGGLSRSEMVVSDNNTAIFRGNVSLENNGGFASVRTRPNLFDLDGYSGLVIRVKGDGNEYQVRLRMDNRFDGLSYRYVFQTESNKWQNIKTPFSDFVPTFRGRIIKDAPALMPEQIQQLGFLISGKQEGGFQLEVEFIKAYK